MNLLASVPSFLSSPLVGNLVSGVWDMFKNRFTEGATNTINNIKEDVKDVVRPYVKAGRRKVNYNAIDEREYVPKRVRRDYQENDEIDDMDDINENDLDIKKFRNRKRVKMY